jgi:hypothetical protein
MKNSLVGKTCQEVLQVVCQVIKSYLSSNSIRFLGNLPNKVTFLIHLSKNSDIYVICCFRLPASQQENSDTQSVMGTHFKDKPLQMTPRPGV